MKSQIITLCGSARFEEHFHFWSKVLTLSGHTVFSLACFPSIEGGKDWYTREAKELLDEAHKLKILRSDAILILNVDDYIGDSTRKEILWAQALGKDLFGVEKSFQVGLYSMLTVGSANLVRGHVAENVLMKGLHEKA